MWQDNIALTRRLVIIGVLVFVCLTAITVYLTQGYTFNVGPSTSTYRPLLSNGELLANWLPTDSYNYTVARIDDYLQANTIRASSLTITSDITTSGGAYEFTVLISPAGQTIDVSVDVTNYNSVISTAVTINGQQQAPLVSTNTPNATTFTGIDQLVAKGLSVTQVNNLELAFEQFAPSGASIAVSTSNSSTTIDPNTGTATYAFFVTINNKAYKAMVICPDLTSAQLILLDIQTGKQLFNSGPVNSAT